MFADVHEQGRKFFKIGGVVGSELIGNIISIIQSLICELVESTYKNSKFDTPPHQSWDRRVRGNRKVSTTVVNCWIDCKNVSKRVATQRLPRLAFSLSSWVVKKMTAVASGTAAMR